MEILQSHTTLLDFFEKLNKQAIKALVASKIYERGKDYYQEDNVQHIEVLSQDKITAKVYGSSRYKISIFRQENNVVAECSCPYSDEYMGVCKHVIAVLLQAIEDDIANELGNANATIEPVINTTNKPIFEDYLANLSVDELQALVKKYMPESERKAIELQLSSQDSKEKFILDSKQLILRFLEKFKCSTSDEYESVLMPYLGQVKGLWLSQPLEIAALLVKILEHIEQSMDNDSFERGDNDEEEYDDYDDYYDDEEIPFSGTEIPQYICDFLAALPTDTKVACIEKIWEKLSESGYDSSLDAIKENLEDYLTAKDMLAFKPYFFQIEQSLSSIVIKEKLYRLLHPVLNNTERGNLLEKWAKNNDTFAVPLIYQYETELKKPEKALAFLDKKLFDSSFFTNHNSNALFDAHIRLSQQLAPDNLAKVYENYLQKLPSIAILEEATEAFPAAKDVFESIMSKKNLETFIQYLEKKNRKAEALHLIENSQGYHINHLHKRFLLRYAQDFPEKTKAFFYARLEENLKSTGDNYYDEVVACLEVLKQVGNPEAFKELLAEIRGEYKRRTNLMRKLATAFK